jgi:hypothetical protein
MSLHHWKFGTLDKRLGRRCVKQWFGLDLFEYRTPELAPAAWRPLWPAGRMRWGR